MRIRFGLSAGGPFSPKTFSTCSSGAREANQTLHLLQEEEQLDGLRVYHQQLYPLGSHGTGCLGNSARTTLHVLQWPLAASIQGPEAA